MVFRSYWLVELNYMLAIAISVNLYLLVSVVLAAFLIGFLFRSTQIRLLKGKIVDLEKEMLMNHADILELQKQKAHLEQNLQASKIPVIPLNPDKADTRISTKKDAHWKSVNPKIVDWITQHLPKRIAWPHNPFLQLKYAGR